MANRCELTGEYWLSKKQMVQIYHVSIAFGPSPKRKNIHVSSPFYCWELNYIVYRSVSYIPSKNQPVFLQPLVDTLSLGKPRKRLSGAHVLRLQKNWQPRLTTPDLSCGSHRTLWKCMLESQRSSNQGCLPHRWISVYPFIPYQLLFRQLVEQSVWQTWQCLPKFHSHQKEITCVETP